MQINIRFTPVYVAVMISQFEDLAVMYKFG